MLLANKEIPGLGDTSSLDLSWASSNTASASASTTPGARAGSTSTDYGAEGTTTRGQQGTGTADSEDGHGGDKDDDAVAAAAAAGGSSSDKDVHIQLEQAPTVTSDHSGHHRQQHPHRQDGGRDHQNMDYEVADEEQWGY